MQSRDRPVRNEISSGSGRKKAADAIDNPFTTLVALEEYTQTAQKIREQIEKLRAERDRLEFEQAKEGARPHETRPGP